jgi:hypothetical protein
MSLDATLSGENSNSFCDVTSADTYHGNRLHNNEWDEASDSDKEASLVQATYMLNELEWSGTIDEDSVQALRFPREELLDKDGRTLSGIPTFLINATSELALHLLREEFVSPSLAAAQKRVKAGSVELEYFEVTPIGGQIPSKVMGMVYPYISGGPNSVSVERV